MFKLVTDKCFLRKCKILYLYVCVSVCVSECVLDLNLFSLHKVGFFVCIIDLPLFDRQQDERSLLLTLAYPFGFLLLNIMT